MEEVVNHWNVDTAVIWSTLQVNMDTEKLGEGKFIEANEESSCDGKDKDIPKEVAPEKNSH